MYLLLHFVVKTRGKVRAYVQTYFIGSVYVRARFYNAGESSASGK